MILIVNPKLRWHQPTATFQARCENLNSHSCPASQGNQRQQELIMNTALNSAKSVGIIGSGGVAQTLAAGFLKHGHSVMLGTRDAAKLSEFLAAHPQVRVGSAAEAAAFAELAVLAVKGTAAVEAARSVATQLAGKTVIDTTNPIADAAPTNGVLSYFTGPNESLLERLQAACPQVKFVKAFNSVGAAGMVNPVWAGGPPTMFIAGDDAAAKDAVTQVLTQFGWDSADMGSSTSGRALEPLCMLWCIPGILNNQWSHAFKLLRA
jgi:8-hydroxy-5-deazaflavin:NADPH oxidoreductase